MNPDTAIERWAAFRLRVNGGLGYSGSTPIARMLAGDLTLDVAYGPQTPRHVDKHGLPEYIVVERVLSRLKPCYRKTLEVEHIEPLAVVGKTAVKRAAHLGITVDAYRARLRHFRTYLRQEVEGR